MNPDENEKERLLHQMQNDLQGRGFDNDVIQLLGRAVVKTGLPAQDIVSFHYNYIICHMSIGNVSIDNKKNAYCNSFE